MSRATQQFSSVKTEGGLLPQDILARIQAGDPELTGTKADTYHLGAHERIGEAANQAWSHLVASWHAFHEALAKDPEDAPATGLTRDRWLLPLFEILGYGRLPKGTAIEVEGKSYAVSHTWHHSPIHLLGCRVDLDTRQKGVAGAAMSSPHGLVQDFLNRSDAHLWGFVTNGYQLRVLRDHHSLTRQAYLEFDLQAIMEGEQYSEFLLLWLVCHQSRVEADKPEECWLETWVNTSRDEGVRALDKLRDGVEKAIEAFGTGFLAHKANTRLKAALESGELDSQEYYRQILRLVYRLIFLFVAEERDALLDPNATDEARARYRRYYATRRIRELADKRRGGPHGDLWQGIALVMEKLDDGYPALGLPALGSTLWGEEACSWLMDAECANDHVLTAVRLLSHIQDGKTRYPVNWRNVGADELGSIYEGLLELHPRMNKEAGSFDLDTGAGHERRTTGSYYTPTSLVDCLLDSSLEPVLDEAAKTPNPEHAILDLKVCDPACGSGHFLVAAARRIAKRLASVRSGDDEPSPRDVQSALRDVVGNCLYGVDLNPMAVELCKVSLWMEAIDPGKPLSFLDSHIQCGNSLLGGTPALMSRGIPDDAWGPIEGDDKEVAMRLKKRNRVEGMGQTTLFTQFLSEPGADFGGVVRQAQGVEKVADDSIIALREKQRRWGELSQSAQFKDSWFLADAWCAAFVWPKQSGDLENAAITNDSWRRINKDVSTTGRLARKTVREAAREYRFFHWHLAFPQIFGDVRAKFEKEDTGGWSNGFDVVLGNPPWERIKLQEKEYFATRNEGIANARKAATRRKMIAALSTSDPTLHTSFQIAKRVAEGSSALIRNSSRYPFCGRGDVNTYTIFAELSRTIISHQGRAGCVVPSGIATDDTTKFFFQDLVFTESLFSLFDFENKNLLFSTVAPIVRFCCLTFGSGVTRNQEPTRYAFFLHDPSELSDPERLIALTSTDIQRINPNTRTCPILKTRRDAEIVKAVYQRIPVLKLDPRDDATGVNPWGISFLTMFHMTNDSSLFRTKEELEERGCKLAGSTFSDGGHRYLPLYESKLLHQFNHRPSTFDGTLPEDRFKMKAATNSSSIAKLQDPAYTMQPRFWVDGADVAAKDPSGAGWFVSFRGIGNVMTNSRNGILAVIPRSAVGNSSPIIILENRSAVRILLAAFNSFPFDYIARQKISGGNLNLFIVKQFACPSPETFERWCGPRIEAHVLELTYTAWDLENFAKDCGFEGPPFRWDEARRFLLRCELDAGFFHLYGIERDEVDYIMETFPIVRRRDEVAHGDYRTKLQILEIYDAMQQAINAGESYQSLLDPPAAHISVAHRESTRPDWARVTH